MNKDKIRKLVNDLPINFKELREETFEMNGIKTETIIFDYNGNEFVFVDGAKDVELGWAYNDNISEILKEGIRKINRMDYDYFCEEEFYIREDYKIDKEEAIKSGDIEIIEEVNKNFTEDLEYIVNKKNEVSEENFENFIENFKRNLDKYTSPVRKVNINPMLVEVDSNYLEYNMTYDEVIEKIKNQNFRLPTEDEWEYLCSGGKRTLFRWGDDYSVYDLMNMIFSYESIEGNIIDKPNMFGLYICYNPYQYEILSNSYYLKGGDGGKSICGGDGIINVLPCFSSFYREYEIFDKYAMVSKDFYKVRRVISL